MNQWINQSPWWNVDLNQPRFQRLVKQYVKAEQFMTAVATTNVADYHTVDVALRTESYPHTHSAHHFTRLKFLQRGVQSRPTVVSRILDNVQIAIFTSTKSAQYVQILLLGHKRTCRIPRGTSDFRGVGIRHSSCRPISVYTLLSEREAQIPSHNWTML